MVDYLIPLDLRMAFTISGKLASLGSLLFTELIDPKFKFLLTIFFLLIVSSRFYTNYFECYKSYNYAEDRDILGYVFLNFIDGEASIFYLIVG
jgi:hypothetical protein